ncbi:2'-5' RNA ligase family protein [Planococcus sp. FY231025]|uniref:2'-5' RNA ligase family protein n=1 Tax=Planococcus sp. FY231025 TaxID=3455699 RepID=UPI003F914EB6
MQLLVLRLDYRASTQIEYLQQQGQTAALQTEKALPPHISLQSFEGANPLDLKGAVAQLAEGAKAVPLTFGSLGFFKQKGTFFASPAVTPALSVLHQTINLATRDFSGQQAYYQPGSWVPHATIVNNIAAPFWGPMFARLSMEFEPFAGKAIALECWSIVNGKTATEWSIFLAE